METERQRNGGKDPDAVTTESPFYWDDALMETPIIFSFIVFSLYVALLLG
jgi:hypothetical protein